MPSSKLCFLLAATLAAFTPACANVSVDSTQGKGGAGGLPESPTCSGNPDVGGQDVPPPPLPCGGDQIVIVGEQGGQPITVPVQSTTSIRTKSAYWQSLDPTGNAFFAGDEPFSIDDGTVHAARAWLQMPAGAPDATTWFCDDTGANVGFASPKSTGLLAGATLSDLRKLGACPGAPVTGQLDYCIIGNQACSWGTIGGTIDGDPITYSVAAGAGPGDWPSTQTVILEDGGLLLLSVTDSAPTGVLIEPACGRNAGALYCIGSITPGSLPGRLVLGGLSRLGRCSEAPPVAGTLSMCVGPS